MRVCTMGAVRKEEQWKNSGVGEGTGLLLLLVDMSEPVAVRRVIYGGKSRRGSGAWRAAKDHLVLER